MSECACEKCVKACHGNPGWFKPGEAERAAAHLGIPFEQFSRQFLIKDSCSNWGAPDAPWVWSPRKASDGPDEHRTYRSQRTNGTCVFLENDRCRIHAVKPYECRAVLACDRSQGGFRDGIEQAYLFAGAPLGMRPEPEDGIDALRMLGTNPLFWTIYRYPTDFPHHWVVRGWVGARPCRVACLCSSLDEARATLPPGLTRLALHACDDPVIFETWI